MTVRQHGVLCFWKGVIMQRFLLDDDTYKELFVLTKSEYEAIDADYRSHASFDKSIRTAFLPGYGTTLFFENRHFLVIDEKEPVREYEVWRYQKIIGHCQITKRAADKANRASNCAFYLEPVKKRRRAE